MAGKVRLCIGGFERSYMERLSLYIKKYFGERVCAVICAGAVAGGGAEEPAGASCGEGTQGFSENVFIGTEEFINEAKEKGAAHRIILSEDETCADEPGEVPVIPRYIPASQICRRLSRTLEGFGILLRGGSADETTRWTCVTTDGDAFLLTAFCVTLCEVLGEEMRVLFINLAACSGIDEMIGAEAGEDLSDLIIAMREGERPGLCGYVVNFESFSAFPGMTNPVNLSEISAGDAENIRTLISLENAFDSVVVAAGVISPGAALFIRDADRCIHITKENDVGGGARREWGNALSVLREGKEPAKTVEVPRLDTETAGAHAPGEWAAGMPGEIVRELLAENGK